MQKTNKKHFAFTDIWRNEKGFTFIHLLTSIIILFLTLPFIAELIHAAQYRTNYEMLSAQQFFHYMQTEMNEATGFYVKENTVMMKLSNGDTANFDVYQDQIRRQVAGKGHEVYLRDIKNATFKEISNGVKTIIETMDGKKHEKIIFYYE